ncbi:MAG: hypothetical protein WAM88_14105 [Nitrososphaeraceae archaeon]
MLPPSLENNSGNKVQVQILSVTLLGISNGNDVIACKFKIYRKPFRAIYSLGKNTTNILPIRIFGLLRINFTAGAFTAASIASLFFHID